MGTNSEIRGTLFLHSETGTEGGYWAIQDEDYIAYVNPAYPPFTGHDVSNLDETRFGRVVESMHEDGSRLSSARKGDQGLHIVEWEDGEQEILPTAEVRARMWSYNGLRMLQTGDTLTVYEKLDPAIVAWQGLVRLVNHDESLDRQLTHPFRLHHDQEGVDQNLWAHWFLEEYPGMVVREEGFEQRTAPEDDWQLKDN